MVKIKSFREINNEDMQVEHCSKPNCPECTLKAYQAGFKKGVEDSIEMVKRLLVKEK